MRPLALAVAVALVPTAADAEGERGPMIGGGLVAVRGDAIVTELAGVQLEGTWWLGRVGLAVEGSQVWDLDSSDPRTTTLGASARLLVFDRLLESLIDPRDVELGLELQGIVERAWWQGADVQDAATTRYGVGVAIRLRGGGDADHSTLLAESRLFVRVFAPPRDREDDVLRTTMPVGPEARDERTILVGLGAAWGKGHRRYADRFRMRPLDSESLLDERRR